MILSILTEGGPLFMYTLLIILLAILGIGIKGFVKKHNSEKDIRLIGSLSLFALVWGFLGQVLGLIQAFDTIQLVGNVSMEILAGGLKVSFLSTMFGLVVFLIGRFIILIKIWINQN